MLSLLLGDSLAAIGALRQVVRSVDGFVWPVVQVALAVLPLLALQHQMTLFTDILA